MDKFTKEMRSQLMEAIKSKNTSIERELASRLWKAGLRYRKNPKNIPGTPDLAFPGKKVAIFVDGEFWHGKDWERTESKIGTNREFWHKKIERNMERDREVNRRLSDEGWTVIRFWGKEIKKNPDGCVEKVLGSMGKI